MTAGGGYVCLSTDVERGVSSRTVHPLATAFAGGKDDYANSKKPKDARN